MSINLTKYKCVWAGPSCSNEHKLHHYLYNISLLADHLLRETWMLPLTWNSQILAIKAEALWLNKYIVSVKKHKNVYFLLKHLYILWSCFVIQIDNKKISPTCEENALEVQMCVRIILLNFRALQLYMFQDDKWKHFPQRV